MDAPVGPFRKSAAVFDCDGLLLDTAPSWQYAFEQAVGEPLEAQVLAALAGSSTRTAAHHLSRELGKTVEAGLIESYLIASLEFADLQPLPGVESVLSVLRRWLPMAVATNGPRPFVEKALGKRLAPFFEVVLSSEEAGEDKPEPGVYLAACAALGFGPGNAVAFEDSERGAASARAAGLELIVVNPELPSEIPCDLLVPQIDDPRVIAFLRTGVGHR